MLWLLPIGFGLALLYPSQTAATVGVVTSGARKVFGPFMPKSIPQDRLMTAARPLLGLIAQHEAGGDYNVVYGGKRYPLTSMTIAQVYALQNSLVRQNKVSSAVGRYQFIQKTLRSLVGQLKLDPNTAVLDEGTQDRMALQLLINRGFERFLQGRMSKASFARALSMEWASMPKDASNRTYYEDGINRALTTYNTVLAALDRSKQNYGVA